MECKSSSVIRYRRSLVIGILVFVFSLGWSLVWSPSSFATLTTLPSFEEMVKVAEKIFLGTVKSIEEKPSDANHPFPSIVTTFEVHEVFKGNVEKRISIRQVGRKVGKASRLKLLIGLPDFRVGEKSIVLLPKPGRYVSPVAFEHGVFRVLAKTKSLDQAVVSNGNSNRSLFRKIQSSTFKASVSRLKIMDGQPLTISSFRELVKGVAQ